MMAACGVAKGLRKLRKHCFHYPCVARRGGVVVEVNGKLQHTSKVKSKKAKNDRHRLLLVLNFYFDI
jgi:hypothetical protein